MKRLVIDIETVGTPWEEHDNYVREYLIKGLSEAEAEEQKRRGALSPFTGRVVAIGVMNADDARTCALFEVPGQSELVTRKEGMRTYISGTEKQVLEKFWEFLGREDRFISFNGRQFDGPFLMIRSAIHGIVPKRDLVGSRYRLHPNCDLREALMFLGAVYGRQFRFNLDLACKAFGIESSKSEGMDGRAVETMYRAGRYQEIADYCLEDVRATADLYRKLVPTLLSWDTQFHDSEERDARARSRELAASLLSPPKETSSFSESLAAGGAELAAALEREDSGSEPFVGEKQPATILEKLIRADEESDDPLLQH